MFVERDAEQVLYAEAKGQNCTLVFPNKETFDFGLRLKKFQDLVAPSGKFLRVHNSFLVREETIVDCRWLFAFLCTGDMIPLSRKANSLVRKLLGKA
jgi:DNA-binding LytR/AlgR family response regulator